jgi:serine/threonine protein kinase
MRTTINLINAGFSRRISGPGTTSESSRDFLERLPRTPRAVEMPPPYKPTARAVVKGFPTLPGYKILAELGHGGMGVVYKARDMCRQRIVAIKVCKLRLLDEREVAARFHQEQILSVRLRHPNLVAAFDAGQIDGLPYLVMEFVEGHDFSWLVEQQGPLAVTTACEVVRQAALGLQHLHKQALVHRDVKPANLMLTSSGLVKLLDLGLARDLQMPASERQSMSQGNCLGTLDYIAPEQCLDSHTVDSRADIYALGCTLYQLLTGQPPFADSAHESVFLKMKAHLEEPVPPIQGQRPEVEERLAAVLGRMLAKDRRRRFATAAGVAAALQPFADAEGLAGLSLALSPSAIVAA